MAGLWSPKPGIQVRILALPQGKFGLIILRSCFCFATLRVAVSLLVLDSTERGGYECERRREVDVGASGKDFEGCCEENCQMGRTGR